jgi:uncharacterized iron-regulated membrane protein
MSFRKVLFWMHLTAGVTAGLVILVMSVTGVLLTYERQMTEWSDGYSVTPPTPDARPLGVEQLTVIAREGRRGELASITLRSEPAPAAFSFGRGPIVFLDPYTGKVLGEGSGRARAFFRGVTDWHRWLAAEGELRPTGRAVTGASNLVFLFIVLSGIYLWWPKNLRLQHLRPITAFQGGLASKARDFNWHNVFGFWSALPLAFVVASGVVMSYPWANDLVYRLAGSEPPRRGPAPRRPDPGGPGAEARTAAAKPEVTLAGLDRAWATAQGQMSGWRTATLRVPSSPEAPFSFGFDTSSGARRPSTRAQVVVDHWTGEVVRREPYASQPRGQKVRGWLRFIHTGEAFGAFGQTVAGLASAGAVMLVWSGLSLALRRFAAFRKRRSRQPTAFGIGLLGLGSSLRKGVEHSVGHSLAAPPNATTREAQGRKTAT